MMNLTHLDVREAAHAVASGEVSAEELAHACLDRISAREDEVRAFEYLDPGYAPIRPEIWTMGCGSAPSTACPSASRIPMTRPI